jgi:hypothetical protein
MPEVKELVRKFAALRNSMLLLYNCAHLSPLLFTLWIQFYPIGKTRAFFG